MINLKGKVIRMCLHCKAIYLDDSEGTFYVKGCKYCDMSTAFFESFEHFCGYIDQYGIDTDDILDPTLKKMVYEYYGIEDQT